MQQVLTNLLSNAIKFTADGVIKLETHPLSHPDEDRTRVLFSISDSGPGIPDNKFAELFAPFSQVHEGYQRHQQGAGLGLTICKQLVELMGGNIAIESNEAHGTTVYFCVPFSISDQVEPTATKTNETENKKTKLKVLLVEDEAISRLAAKKQMEIADCEVTAVENGQLALDAAASEEFHIIMMDIQMPIMDGVAATKAIRNGKAGQSNMNIPIVAMTAYAMKGDRENFLEAGMDAYLSKPIEHKKLLKMLDNFR